MRLTLSRFLYRTDGIISRLVDEQDQQLCVTLEHAYGDANPSPKLQAGTYHFKWTDLPTLGWCFLICDVPGHEGMALHAGNFERDSDGCVLVGETFLVDTSGRAMVTNSWRALAKLLARLHTVTEGTLIVQDAPMHEPRRAA